MADKTKQSARVAAKLIALTVPTLGKPPSPRLLDLLSTVEEQKDLRELLALCKAVVE
jgi:hypothetical protein